MEGLLFAFHLEGSALNWKAHLLLVISIFAAAGAILAELRYPSSALLGIVRAQLVLLQGVWFMQIAKLLFEGACDLLFVCEWRICCLMSAHRSCEELLALVAALQI